MSDIKIVVGADVSQATSGLRAVQGELGKTASVAKTATGAFSSIGSSIGSLAGSLLSGGILTGIALVGAGLIELTKELLSVSKEQERFNEVLDGASGSYIKAVQDIERVGDAFQKAKDGVISKEKALQIYNSTIGQTLGQTDDLNIAEAEFTNGADAYVKATFLKAAANIALSKASAAAFKAEQARMEGPESLSFLERIASSRYGAIGKVFGAQSKVNDALKEQNQFLEIYNNLLAQSKQALSGVTIGLGEENGIIGKIKDRLQELSDALPGLKTKEAIHQNVTETKALNKELDNLLEKGKKIKEQLINTRHFNLLEEENFIARFKQNTPFKAGKATFKPDLTIVPNVKKVVITKEQQDKVMKAMKRFFDKEALEKFQGDATDAINGTIFNILNDTISTMSDAIADLAVSGGKDVPRLFDNLIKGIGGQIKELGKYLVSAGLEMLGAKKAIKLLGLTPQTAIVAGIALEVLGALLTAAANKKSSNVGFASGVRNFSGGFTDINERGAERVFLPRGSSVQPHNEVQAYGGGSMVFIPDVRLQGSDLVIAFNRASQQMGRNN